MKTVRILTFIGIKTKEELHELLFKRLCLPAHYGGNADALFDCLTDIAEDTQIILFNTEELKSSLGKYGEVILKVFADAARANGHITLGICG